jgi:type VI secretion system protein ImpF
MAGPEVNRDRLQPALLDRLTDDAPLQKRPELDDRRVMSKTQLREAVLRDLRWLLNAVQPLSREADRHPRLAGSVLNFGLPPLSGQLASRIDVGHLLKELRAAILRYEPRILPETLVVRAVEADSVMATHNVIEFQISGHLWAQPLPLEILLRTQLDLEAGQVEVRDEAGSVPSRVR